MGLSVEQLLGSDPDAIRQQLIAQEMKALNPTGGAAGALGMLLGGGIANVSQGRGFFESNVPGVQRITDVNNIMKSVRFDPNNPAQYYQQVGVALQDAGYGDLAPMAFAEAQKVMPKDKFITGKAGDIIYRQTPTGALEKVAAVPDKDTIVKTNEATARAAGELGFGVRPNLSDYSEQELRAINNLIQNRGERVQAAGVPKTQPKEINKNKADLSLALEKQAIDADTQLTNATTINGVLERAFTGVASGAVLKVGQIADALGVTVSGTTESEQLNQLLAKLAQGQAKSLPGPLSEKELTFLREAIGTSGATKETLRNVVKRIQQDAYTTIIANNKLQSYQSEGKDLNKFDFAKNTREARRLATLLEKASPEQRKQILGY